MSASNPKTFLRLKEVARRTSYSRSRIYELVQLGTFPAPIPLGGRAIAWLEDEICQWMDQRIAARDRSGVMA